MQKDIYEEIVALRTKGIPAALATIIARKGATPRKDSTKMLIYADGRQLGTIGGGSIEAEVCREALQILEIGKPKLLTLKRARSFAEVLWRFMLNRFCRIRHFLFLAPDM
jgi:xanthine dehydrogenase accessory factor